MSINPITSFANSTSAKKYMDWAVKEKSAVVNGIETKVSNYSRLQKHYPKFFMIWLAATQGYFLYTSKDMSEERKFPLILNTLFSCTIAIVTGALLGKHISKLTNKMAHRANDIYKSNEKSDLIDGIKTGVPFLTEVLLFEYLGPVIATPLSIHAASYMTKKGIVNLNGQAKKDKAVDNRKESSLGFLTHRHKSSTQKS